MEAHLLGAIRALVGNQADMSITHFVSNVPPLNNEFESNVPPQNVVDQLQVFYY